jgi:PAS domain S-box-containing protein
MIIQLSDDWPDWHDSGFRPVLCPSREARTRPLIDSNIIGLFFWNLAGDAPEANDAFLRIVGYSRRDLLSSHARWDSMTPPEYRATDAKATEELRQAGTCQPYENYRRIPVLMGAAPS